jgi:hypothetical protein
MAPKITSSSNRSKRSSTKPVTKGQYPQRQNRQSVSQANVTRSGDPRPAGAPPAKVTSSADRPKSSGLSIVKDAMSVLSNLRRATPAGAAYEVMRPRPTASGTLPASQARRVEAQRTQGAEFARQERAARQGNKGRENSSFDDAFAAARKAGVKTFSWKGRKYNTKMKGE